MQSALHTFVGAVRPHLNIHLQSVRAVLVLAALLAAAGSQPAAAQSAKSAAVPPAAPPAAQPLAAPPASKPPAAQPDDVSPPDIKTPPVRIRVDVVNVPVTVLNKRGLPVIDMTKDDFQVFEDGVRREIKYFNRETQMPLMMGVIMDTSNSARRQLEFAKDAVGRICLYHAAGPEQQEPDVYPDL